MTAIELDRAARFDRTGFNPTQRRYRMRCDVISQSGKIGRNRAVLSGRIGLNITKRRSRTILRSTQRQDMMRLNLVSRRIAARHGSTRRGITAQHSAARFRQTMPHGTKRLNYTWLLRSGLTEYDKTRLGVAGKTSRDIA